MSQSCLPNLYIHPKVLINIILITLRFCRSPASSYPPTYISLYIKSYAFTLLTNMRTTRVIINRPTIILKAFRFPLKILHRYKATARSKY